MKNAAGLRILGAVLFLFSLVVVGAGLYPMRKTNLDRPQKVQARNEPLRSDMSSIMVVLVLLGYSLFILGPIAGAIAALVLVPIQAPKFSIAVILQNLITFSAFVTYYLIAYPMGRV